MTLSNKYTQDESFKFGNKMRVPIMTFAGKLNSIRNNLNRLQKNMEDKPKQSDLEKHTQRLQNTHHFN
jgi:hypothetical protein